MTTNVIKEQIAYWSDLVADAYNTVKNLCQNIDTYPSNVVDDLKQNNSTYTLASESGVALTGKVNNAKLKQVSSSTVRTQLNDFLASRGLDNKNNPYQSGSKLVMTAKAIINFYNNVAIFIRARIHVYQSSIDGSKIYIYDDSDITYESPNISDSVPQTFNITHREATSAYSRFIDTYNRMTSNQNTAIISYSSSSSSSSSSCSSSCSSSSSCSCSSSSSYIVYMLIR